MATIIYPARFSPESFRYREKKSMFAGLSFFFFRFSLCKRFFFFFLFFRSTAADGPFVTSSVAFRKNSCLTAVASFEPHRTRTRFVHKSTNKLNWSDPHEHSPTVVDLTRSFFAAPIAFVPFVGQSYIMLYCTAE